VNNLEQEEAKKVLDQLAREIHGIYGQHAVEAGLKTPKWEELPEPAKRISRDIARLTLTKMVEAHIEGAGLKDAPRKPVEELPKVDRHATLQLPKSWSAEEALHFVKGIGPEIEKIVSQVADAKRPNPVEKGLNRALAKVTESIALTVLQESPGLTTRLRQIVEGELMHSIVGDEGDEKEEV
jgi:hypothetical protein